MTPLKVSNKDNLMIMYVSPSIFPDGRTRVPDLLTEEEAIRFLRLDIDGPKDSRQTLKYYRDQGFLHPTKVGKRNRYLRTELLRFLDEQTYGKAA